MLASFVFTAFSGCAVCGKTDSYGIDFQQSGIYARMPPPGETGRYTVEEGGPASNPIRHASWEDRLEGVDLRVSKDDSVHFSYFTVSAGADDAAWQELNTTFEELNLGRPSLLDYDYQHRHIGCFS